MAAFGNVLARSNKIVVLGGDWTLGYHSLKLRYFPNIFQFSEVLSLESFDNS